MTETNWLPTVYRIISNWNNVEVTEFAKIDISIVSNRHVTQIFDLPKPKDDIFNNVNCKKKVLVYTVKVKLKGQIYVWSA